MTGTETITLPDGSQRRLGNKLPPAGLTRAWKTYGDTPETPLIPRKDWKPVDLSRFMSPVKDQNGEGACFPKGTLVRMADGTQKPIEDVKVLDEVLTAEGRTKRVIRTIARQEQESLYRLHLWGHRHLKATAEHPILTKRGYVAVAELKQGDMVALPRYSPQSQTSVLTADYISKRVYTSRAKKLRILGLPGRPSATIVRHMPPDVIQLSPKFGRIIGLYLAEGWTDSGKVSWAFNATERDTLAAELVRLIKDVLGAEASIRERKKKTCVNVVLYGTWWAQLFEGWCAKGCDGKRIHRDLMAGPRDFLTEVLRGWTDGDGIGDDREGGVTVSHTLAVNLFDTANALGYRPTIETLDIKVNASHGVKSRRKRYLVRWRDNLGNRADDWRSELTETHTFRRVDGVVREDFSGWVFNLEVEDDNSYVAEGVGVHNCNAFDTVYVVEGCRAIQGLPHITLSPGYLYGNINGGSDNGSTLEDAMQWMMEHGTCTAATVGELDWQNRPPAAAEEAKKYRVLEAFVCPTFEHMASAIQCGFLVSAGVNWCANYQSPDQDGWLPHGRGSVGGHAIARCSLVERNGVWGLGGPNSWGTSYGINGYFTMPEPGFEGQVGGWWAVREVVDEGGVVPIP